MFFKFLMLTMIVNAETVNFCFDREISLEKAKGELSTIATQNDQIDMRRGPHCLEVTVSESRIELFDKYLRRVFPGKVSKRNIFSGFDEPAPMIPDSHCNIEIEQKGIGTSQGNQYGVGSKNIVRQTNTNETSSSKMRMVLTKGRTGRLRVNDRDVEISCFPRGRQFQVDVSIAQSKGSVATSLTVSSGQQIDLGDIVEQFERNGRLLDINQGVQVNKEKGQSKSQYFLTVQ